MRSEINSISLVALVQEPEHCRESLQPTRSLSTEGMPDQRTPKCFESPVRNFSTTSERSVSEPECTSQSGMAVFSFMLLAISARLPCSRMWLTISQTSDSDADRIVATMTSRESFFSFNCSISRFKAPFLR